MVGTEVQLDETEEGIEGHKVVPVKLEHVQGVLQPRRVGKQSVRLGGMCPELFKEWWF